MRRIVSNSKNVYIYSKFHVDSFKGQQSDTIRFPFLLVEKRQFFIKITNHVLLLEKNIQIFRHKIKFFLSRSNKMVAHRRTYIQDFGACRFNAETEVNNAALCALNGVKRAVPDPARCYLLGSF